MFAVGLHGRRLGAPFLGAADAKKLPCPCPGEHSKSSPEDEDPCRKYKGTTEEGGTVSFRMTRDRQYRRLHPHQGDPVLRDEISGNISISSPSTRNRSPITRGPIPMRGVSKRYPQGKELEIGAPGVQGGLASDRQFTAGKVVDPPRRRPVGSRCRGKASTARSNLKPPTVPPRFPSSENPTPIWAPGTEFCTTRAIDWDAKKPGDRGFVFE